MKLKSLSFLLLSLSLGMIYITMSSDINGNTSSGGTSCSTCHGSANTNTTVALTGLPTTFITNQTYTLTFNITNPTLSHAGLNIKCSGGTLTAGTNTHLSNSQITHNSPGTSTSSAAPYTTSFTFTWKAPATTSAVTFNCAGNAVNNDGQDSNADQWNATSYTITGTFPTSVSNMEESNLTVYPNPASGLVRLEGMANASKVQVFSLFGQAVSASSTVQGQDMILDMTPLPIGSYLVIAEKNGQRIQSHIEKN